MNKKIILSLIIILSSICATFGQDFLDTVKYKDAELFVVKKDYDIQQRLHEIRANEGKEVTVFEVAGKKNKIKATYTGICESSTVADFSDKQKASLIVVRVYEKGALKTAYFPLTNSNNYRIYLTEKMK